jgi:hypothetical protein
MIKRVGDVETIRTDYFFPFFWFAGGNTILTMRTVIMIAVSNAGNSTAVWTLVDLQRYLNWRAQNFLSFSVPARAWKVKCELFEFIYKTHSSQLNTAYLNLILRFN